MSKHTPGPWKARRVDNQQWEIDAPNGDPTIGYSHWKGFVWVYGSDDYKDKGRMVAEANANLIAAAPEMLDMLKECRATLASVFVYGVPDGLVDRVNTIIQKAEESNAAL